MQGELAFTHKRIMEDMGDFWLSFLELTDALVQNIHVCYTGNMEEYISSKYDMLKYIMAYNNPE